MSPPKDRITWATIDRECSGIRVGPDGMVATYLRHEGQRVDGKRLNMSMFAEHYGIPRRTFSRWVFNASPHRVVPNKPRDIPRVEDPKLQAELRERLRRGLPITSHHLATKHGISRSTLQSAAILARASVASESDSYTEDFDSAACRIETSIELINNIEMDLRRVLNPAHHTLGPLDQHRLRKVLTEALFDLKENSNATHR